MSGWDAWIAVVILLLTAATWGAFAYRRYRLRCQGPPVDPTLDFAEPIVRHRLQRMIQSYGLTGSCNIRDGRVLPCPNQEGKSDLARLLLHGYALGLPANGNVNMMLCVLRDGAWVPTNVTLDDLRTASICLEDS